MLSRAVAAALPCLLLATAVAAQPVVPGFVVTPYATVTDPTALSFAADGTLYTGRDATGSGGGSGDAVKIHRIGAGGAPVEEFGMAAIDDPDGVLVDGTGVVSGTPGSVLVSGANGLGLGGVVSAIAADQSVTTVLGPAATLQNPNYMAFDSTGALLISDSGGAPGVYRFPAGGPLATFLDPGGSFPDNLAVDATGRIFVHLSNGNVAAYTAGGTVENAAFATGLGSNAALAVGPGGPWWGTELYAGLADTGEVVRIDPQGMVTTIGSGFTTIVSIAFGPDGALYVAEFDNDRVLRIAPAPFSSIWEATSGSLPEDVCPAWTLVNTAVPETPVLSSSLLTLGTDTATENMFYVQNGANVSIPDPLVVEARLRFVSGGEVNIRTAPVSIALTTAPNVGVLFFLQADHISLTDSESSEGASATVDTDDDAHTYQLAVRGSAVEVYYDGALTLTGSTYAGTPGGDHGDLPRVAWGEISSGSFGVHEWEFVRHNAAVCVPSTTTTTSTSSTSAPVSSTTTSSSTLVSTTSTTAPPVGCAGTPAGPTFASIRCRIAALRDRVNAESGALDGFGPKLVHSLEIALGRLDDAQARCAGSNLKKTRKRLQQTRKALSQYTHRLGTRAARNKLDDVLRRDFLAAGEAILPDTQTLRAQVSCPGDAGA